MATITEDYVSFETAKLLKEKGFNEYCPKSYFKMDKTLKESGFSEWEKANEIKAPTQSLAMKWLIEVHNINIDIVSIWNKVRWEYQIFIITPKTAAKPYIHKTIYKKREQACEAAIKYCLENLI